jgi:hypothetical protein
MTAVRIFGMRVTLALLDGDSEFLFGDEYEKTHSTTSVHLLCEAACLPREVCAWLIHTSVPRFYIPFLCVDNNKHADGVELTFLRRNMLVLGICTG